MGQAHSRCAGARLLGLVSQDNTSAAKDLLAAYPEASCYSTCIERNSSLLVAAGRGHARMVQAILEAAVLSQGLTRAKKRCINHSNSKGQSALMLACMSGHAQCVEVLVCNGASPLVLDNSRHNSALHWAASCCRADCVGRLLGSGAIFQMQSGQQVPIADIPCFNEDNSTLVKFVDRHNGWGLTALQLATHKGSSSTVRALLRHGASVSARSVAPSLSISPSLQPPGSTALHFAAAAEDVTLVLVLLEAQVSRDEPDLRTATNARGERPIDLAHSSSNPLLHQLLDPAHALSLHPGPRSGLVLNPGSSFSRVVTREGLRQHQALLGLGSGGAGLRGSRRGNEQAAHVALGGLLQRLKLVLSLEAFALQQQLAAAGSTGGSTAAAAAGPAVGDLLAKKQQVLAASAGEDARDDVIGTAPAAGADTAAAVKPHAAAAAAAAADAAGADRRTVSVSPGLLEPQALGGLSTQPEITVGGEPVGDDTQPLPDAHQQQQQQHKQQQHKQQQHKQQQQHSTAEVAAQQVRLRVLQQLMATVDGMLAVLPASAAASGASSPHGSSTPASQQQQQQHAGERVSAAGRIGSAGAAAGSGHSGSWGLLGDLLSRSSTGHHQERDGQQQHQQQQHRLFGRARGSGRHTDSSGSDSSPAAAVGALPAEVLAAYVTPSMLSSLAAVIKLFVGASSLSGQQEQQLLGGGGKGGGSCVSGARWAEQEHALVLMRGILKTLRTSLEAAQQAAAAAASRSALRQRHQQQLASLLGSDNRPVHSSSLRRALLGERLADQGQIRFGGGSSASSRGGSRHDSSSMAAAYLGGLGGLSWGLDAPVGVGASSMPGRHASSRRRHRDRTRRRGEEAAGADAGQEGGSSRRHHRHSSRHHRSGRRRTPRAVDLPMDDIGRPTPQVHAASTAVPDGGFSSLGLSSARQAAAERPAATAAAAAGAGVGGSDLTPEQQHQQYLQQLAGILRQHSSSHGHSHSHSPSRAHPAGEIQAGSTEGPTMRAGGSSSSSGSSSQSEGPQEAGDRGEEGVALPPGFNTADVGADAAESGSESDLAAAPASCSSLDATTCAICMDMTAGVSVSRCSHSLCLRCAYQLCYKAKGLPLCPFCRQPIDGFDVAAVAAGTEC